jgi:WD40 repeat protein
MPRKRTEKQQSPEDENVTIPPGFTLSHTLRGHEAEITRIAWSPDGLLLASPSVDKTIRLWDVQTGQLLHFLIGHASSVFGVAWSPTERTLLASSSVDGTIRLWDTRKGREVRVLEGHTDAVTSGSASN